MPRGRELPTLWRPLPLLALWFAGGWVLSSLTGRVRDWYDMTDELRYERLAISIARSHSLVPRIHGVDVQSFSQLYPLLIAPVFAAGTVPHDLVSAHVLNAWVMSSACIPAYLLARTAGQRRPVALLVGAGAICMPWILYAAMLMTEVAAYPAFLWALLALTRATLRPSPLRDLLALGGLALAFVARTELLVLVFVAPPAIVCFEAGRSTAANAIGRVTAGVRAALGQHRLLAAAYALLLAGGVALAFGGRLAAAVGVYGTYAHQGTTLPPGLAGSFTAHVALFALALGVLPVIVASAWLCATVLAVTAAPERRAFACVAAIATLALLVQATDFDVRYTGFVHDRFLLYLVPLVLIALACALEAPLPRRSLIAPALVTLLGFAVGGYPSFTWKQFPWLTADSPTSGLLRRLAALTGSLGGTRVLLVGATVALCALFALGERRLPRRALVFATGGFTVAALVTTTVLTFTQFFDNVGTSLRPLTASEEGVFDWIDGRIGTNGSATIVPYLVSSNWFASQQRWEDVEFWNKSVVRDALEADDGGGNAFAYTGIWFPKLELRFNPDTGLANVSPTPWVVASDKDTRFAIAGTPVDDIQDVELTRADLPWRAAWISFGLYDDGWTRPGVTARIRIFPYPDQRAARIRIFAFAVHAPITSQPVSIVSDAGSWHGDALNAQTTTAAIPVCVPANGFAEVRISTPVASWVGGDEASEADSLGSRRAGVFFGETALSSKIGGPCRV